LYKNVAIEALEIPPHNVDARTGLAATLRAFETEFSITTALKFVKDNDVQELLERLVALKQLEFYAKYGDYLAIMCQRLKIESRVNETLNHEELSGWNAYWTSIAAKLEKEPWRAFLIGGHTDREQVKTHLAIYHACNRIGLDDKDAVTMIREYAYRNDLVHLSIDQFVLRGDFHPLAVTLFQDLKRLPVVIPHHLGHLEGLYQSLISAVIDENFTMTDMENPGSWVPKDVLASEFLSLKNKEKNAFEKAEKRRDQVIKAAELRFQAKVKDRVLIMQAALSRAESGDPSAIRSPISPSKRQASREHPASTARYGEEGKRGHDDQRKAWFKILAVQKEANKLVDSYEKQYGSFEEPVDYEMGVLWDWPLQERGL
jgi:hypothetical protein